MSEANSKTCPYCAEQINAAAKVCPRCRQWLSLFSLRNPTVLGAAVLLCFMGTGICFQIYLNRLWDPGIDFSSYRNRINVVGSQMNFGTEDKEQIIYVVALITNQTDVAWKEVQLDVRFFNTAGKLIDVGLGYDPATLYPHADSALRIKTRPSHPLSDYDSYKIYVRFARDARAHF
jgi:hypothetical protein